MPADARPIDGWEPWLRYRTRAFTWCRASTTPGVRPGGLRGLLAPPVRHDSRELSSTYQRQTPRGDTRHAPHPGSSCSAQGDGLDAGASRSRPKAGETSAGPSRPPFACLSAPATRSSWRCGAHAAGPALAGMAPDLRLIDRNHTPSSGRNRSGPSRTTTRSGREDSRPSSTGSRLGAIRGRDADRHASRADHGAALRRLLDEGGRPCSSAAPLTGPHPPAARRRHDRGRPDGRPGAEGPVVASLDPSAAWFLGWLDDIPRVAWEFQEAAAPGGSGVRQARRDRDGHEGEPGGGPGRRPAPFGEKPARDAPVRRTNAGRRQAVGADAG